jgi:phosphate transport system ATP-binding protein
VRAGVRRRAELDRIVEESLRAAQLWDEAKDRLHDSALTLSGCRTADYIEGRFG